MSWPSCPLRQNGLLDFLLNKLEPERFPEQPGEGVWYENFKLGLLCLGLTVCPDTPLPTLQFEGLETWEAFGTALSQHYAANGKPLQVANSEEDLRLGFFKDTRNESTREWWVTCRLDHRSEAAVLKFDADELFFQDPFDYTTPVTVKKNGRVFKVDDILQEFAAAGVEPPPRTPKWVGEAFAKKREPSSPKAETPESKGKSKGTKRPSMSPPSQMGVSDALRRRLQGKTGESASSQTNKP